jgi:hypothetical protein
LKIGKTGKIRRTQNIVCLVSGFLDFDDSQIPRVGLSSSNVHSGWITCHFTVIHRRSLLQCPVQFSLLVDRSVNASQVRRFPGLVSLLHKFPPDLAQFNLCDKPHHPEEHESASLRDITNWHDSFPTTYIRLLVD